MLIMGARMSPQALFGNLEKLGIDADVIHAMVSYVQHGDIL